jgi:hypothetical protein
LPRVRAGYGLKDALGPLARADFEGAVAAAGKLNPPAVRGTSMLEIARAVLASNTEGRAPAGPATGARKDSH